MQYYSVSHETQNRAGRWMLHARPVSFGHQEACASDILQPVRFFSCPYCRTSCICICTIYHDNASHDGQSVPKQVDRPRPNNNMKDTLFENTYLSYLIVRYLSNKCEYTLSKYLG